jgi:alpha-glucosidase (family GH31 glycosyl hydrolase)
MLNHYHYIDNARNGIRPMDFSRYAGLGSHRYPIGFSGSTFITWESLDFQPYFTANASNVGYGWWSHDIGGHRNGYRDDELTTRWVQYGVFSPIMRLHSSDEVFTGKEPWKFSADAERVMRHFLTLRHQLIPYTYTMNYRFYEENRPLIEPVYYEYPDREEAYQFKNEYYFGSKLLANPITSKADAETKTGAVKTWLPEGIWFDFFTGMCYRGNRKIRMHRTMDSIPVLAKAGGIVPMEQAASVSSRTDNPKKLLIKIFCGADGDFSLYEDDGISMEYEQENYVTTEMELCWGETKEFTIAAAQGKKDLIPQNRDYELEFYGVSQDAVEQVLSGEEMKAYQTGYDEERHILTVSVSDISVEKPLTVRLRSEEQLQENDIAALAYHAINRAQIPFAEKEQLYRILTGDMDREGRLSTVESMYMPEEMKSVIREILLAL